MSLFSIAPAILSLLGGGAQAREGSNLVSQGQGQINEAVGNAGTAYRDALGLLQQRKAQGEYNAAAALKAAGDQASHDLTLTDKNTASQLATLGYKRGDSPFQQSAAHSSEAANLALQQRQIDTSNAYDQKYNSDLGMVNNYGNAYNSLLMNAGGGNINRGTQLEQSAYGGLTGLIGGGGLSGDAFDFLKPHTNVGVNSTMYDTPIGPTMPGNGGNGYSGGQTQGPDGAYYPGVMPQRYASAFQTLSGARY